MKLFDKVKEFQFSNSRHIRESSQTDYSLELPYTYYAIHDIPEICHKNYFEVKKLTNTF